MASGGGRAVPLRTSPSRAGLEFIAGIGVYILHLGVPNPEFTEYAVLSPFGVVCIP